MQEVKSSFLYCCTSFRKKHSKTKTYTKKKHTKQTKNIKSKEQTILKINNKPKK